MGLNRGEAPYQWKIPLADGATVSQIFTASGEVEQVRDRAEGRRGDGHRAGGGWRRAASIAEGVNGRHGELACGNLVACTTSDRFFASGWCGSATPTCYRGLR